MKNRSSSIILMLSLALSMIVGFGISTIVADNTGAPVEAVFAVFSLGSLAMTFGLGAQSGILASSLDISALTTALGAYFRKDKGVLVREMLLGMNIEDRMEIWDDCKDEVPLPNLGIEDLVKPADATTFSPTSNALKFGARTLKVRPWKVDLQLIPSILEKSWLGAAKPKGSDQYALPFEQFIMQHIIEKIHENIRLKALFKGDYNAAGTTPGAIMDGLLTLVTDEITATNITPVVTGAVTSSNVIDKIEAVYDNLGEGYKNVPTICLVSPTLFDWYVRKYRATYGVNMDYKGMAQGSVMIDGTLCTIMREPGMASSQRIVITPKSNIVYGVDSLGEENNMEVQKFDRTLKIMIDAKSGIQFKEIHARALAVNDQA